VEGYVLTQKTQYVGKESGKSSTRWFGPGFPPGTAASVHGNGARAGDGNTSDRSILGKIIPVFRKGN